MNTQTDAAPRKQFIFNVDVEDDLKIVWHRDAEIGRTRGDETVLVARWLEEHGADDNDDVQVWTHAAGIDGEPAF